MNTGRNLNYYCRECGKRTKGVPCEHCGSRDIETDFTQCRECAASVATCAVCVKGNRFERIEMKKAR